MLALKARAAPAIAPHLRHRLPVATVHRVRFYAVVSSAATPTKSKVWDSVEDAIKDVKSGDILLSGGEQHTLLSLLLRHSPTRLATHFGVSSFGR